MLTIRKTRPAQLKRRAAELELAQMNGGIFGGGPLDWSTIIRFAVVIAGALAVRQLVLRLGSRMIDNRGGKNRSGGGKPPRQDARRPPR